MAISSTAPCGLVLLKINNIDSDKIIEIGKMVNSKIWKILEIKKIYAENW
jgi:hypothetical protein